MPKHNAKPCTIEGRRYPSITAAAAAHEVTRQAMKQRIARRARGLRTPGRHIGSVWLDGRLAPIDVHAQRLGISRRTVYRRLAQKRVDKRRAEP